EEDVGNLLWAKTLGGHPC
ncbi:rCG48762, partial [Rattus norvegicus]